MNFTETELYVILEALNLHYLGIYKQLEKPEKLGDIEKKNLIEIQMLLTELINKLK